jgi:hypothetical protein
VRSEPVTPEDDSVEEISIGDVLSGLKSVANKSRLPPFGARGEQHPVRPAGYR